jgi:hypothetical protein
MVDVFENIRHPTQVGVVYLNFCACTITPMSGHTHPERCDIFGHGWGGASHEDMVVEWTCGFTASRFIPFLVTTNITEVAPVITLKAAYEFEKVPIRLSGIDLPRESKSTKQSPGHLA